MEWIVNVLNFVQDQRLLETLATMLIITILFVWLVRVLVPVLFETRTRNQLALEETYEKHISELKEMMECQSERQEEQQKQLASTQKQLAVISARLSNLTRLVEQYNCNNAPTCENRVDISEQLKEAAQHPACETCTADTCAGCLRYDGLGLA